MANKGLFASLKSLLTRADARNEEGAVAYALPIKHALAQLAATGCFNGAFYANAEDQLATLLNLVNQVDDNVFLAKLAVYSRERAFMKDMPAALLLMLSKRDRDLFRKVFSRVVDNGRVLRTLFQMVRSGQFGRKSLSYALQRAFQRWLNDASVSRLLAASIGNDPSLRDILRLARPTPTDNARRALFGQLTGKSIDKWAPATFGDLPDAVRDLIAYRQAQTQEMQVAILNRTQFRWDLLADAARGSETWKAIARQMGPQALRMNLNTLLRHDVLNDRGMVDFVAAKIADAEEIRSARQFPYQYLSAYLNADAKLPQKIKAALCEAAEIACGNVPELPGPVVIGLDVSGSMHRRSRVIAARRDDQVRCVNGGPVRGAIAAPDSVVIPFDNTTYHIPPSLCGRGRVRDSSGVCRHAWRVRQQQHELLVAVIGATSNLGNRRFAGCVLVRAHGKLDRRGRRSSTKQR